MPVDDARERFTSPGAMRVCGLFIGNTRPSSAARPVVRILPAVCFSCYARLIQGRRLPL
jgi:hypothetical protein